MGRKLIAIAVCAAVGLAAVVTLAPIPVNIPVIGTLFGTGTGFADDAAIRARLKLADGYRINIFATDLGKARVMAMTDAGDILVSDPRNDVIRLVLADRNKDARSDGVRILAKNLNAPHGLHLEAKTLFVAEEDRVSTFRFDPSKKTLSGRRTILKGIPAGEGHSTRTISRGPDGWLYVSVGSSCNVCIEKHPWRSAIIRFRKGDADVEIFAEGLRNTVGFDWQPGTGALYGVNNGRDWLGNDFPPEEMNRIEKGGFYGWPFFNGDNIPDPDYGTHKRARSVTPLPPVHTFGAHMAPLSIRFLRHQSGSGYKNAALVGLHGSWNRDIPAGYQVVSVHWDQSGRISHKPFIIGFEKDEDVIGRPVDTIEGPDGTIYVSDDYAGVIYRVTRKN